MTCSACRTAKDLPFVFSMAFQPIVRPSTGEVFAYEALVRGPAGEGAASVLGAVTSENRYAFDQQCRVKAIELAARSALPPAGSPSTLCRTPSMSRAPASA